jgi:hypothetical protein
MTPISVTPAPVANPGRMPFAHPDFGRHQPRLGAAPKIRSQDHPWIVPSRPRIPSPVPPVRPVPRAGAAPMNRTHEIGQGERRSQDGRRSKRHGRGLVRSADRQSRREHGAGNDGLAHVYLLECPRGAAFTGGCQAARRSGIVAHRRCGSTSGSRACVLNLAIKTAVRECCQCRAEPLSAPRNRASSALPWLAN